MICNSLKKILGAVALSIILTFSLFAQQKQKVELKIQKISGDTIYFGSGIYALLNDESHQVQLLQSNPDSTTVFINAEGRVGIGTSSPSKPLDVATAGGIQLSRTDSISSNNEIYFEDNGQIRSADDNHRIIFDRENDIFEIREYGQILLSPGAISGQRTGKMILNSEGRVGIGTLNPGAALEVNGEIMANLLSVDTLEANKFGRVWIDRSDSISDANEILFSDYGQIRSFNDDHRIIFDREVNIFEVREYGDIHFSTGSTGERTSKVVIKSNGKLGIGTDNPLRPLHIQVPGGIQLNLTDSISPDNEIFFLDNGQIRSANDDHRIIFDRTNNIFEVREYGDIHFSTGSLGQRTSKVVINAAGNLGIGEPNPTKALVVNGQIKMNMADTVLNSDANLVWKSDGTLAIRRYQVGDFVHGGIVFWVDPTGEHGLVCAKEDQSDSLRWHAGTFGITQAKGNHFYAGKMNTAIIISSHVAIGDDGDIYAARLCSELEITENGITYGDWYLPSNEELVLLYQNKDLINATALAHGGESFDLDYYWSSTEYTENSAYGFAFQYGNPVIIVTKASSQNVRAIRSF